MPARFDSDLLSRATLSLDAGPSWNAFGRGQPEETVPEPQSPEPVGKPGGPRVRQRVPGATLHATAPTTRPVDATGADPAAARALVEAFQAGVRRAELHVAPGLDGASTRTASDPTASAGAAVVDLGTTVDLPSTPGGAGPTVPRGGGSTDAAPERPRLSRRVPGANLTAIPVCQPPSTHLGDPAEVRDLISEFEAGVARALREVSPDHRNEEGSSR
ncbi:hypothetical protein ONO86_02110 [Micromonospora noduli]|nr:hypothetical protein ONO86_02110 [Micromonospora noduli]